ncbi:pilus assembly protein [Asticcacaulis sp. EMRT-3]|uniref:TadE/TadG family type IV pilus assembly protein n=1 Tax=Asticcacaulis sp. EMRT-3 TaxID=3040349 RepID=UPI0024AF8E35|nr:pilus assembly protein [Asticcacaulis sp. EMRT-3]MDI7776026.1 pilus assembly protein [Asticcacaulis sp. EMRT-3]
MRSLSLSRAFQALRRRWRDDRRGAAAIEFALVAGPLIFMIMCCIELALVILLSVTLDNATDIAARQIRTGTTTAANSTATDFRQLICNNMTWLAGSCMASLQVDVRTYSNFSLVDTTSPILNGKMQGSVFAYQIGAGSTIQLVRAYYEWPLFTPFLKPGLASLANGDAVITATAVFRNEPF